MTKAEQEAALRATREAERANPGAAVASHGAYQVIGFIVGIPITLVLLLGFFGWLRNL